jgi:DnaJ like chaperone protein
MSWWGKLIGGAFGMLLGGPLGAVLGAALGHGFDRGLAAFPDSGSWSPGQQQRVQMAFFTATFSVMGSVAKADGRVSRAEIALAEAVMAQMGLTGQQRRVAIDLFTRGKEADFPWRDAVRQFRKECHGRSQLLRIFLEIQIQAAYADGGLTTAEEQMLLQICRDLGFSEVEFRQLEQMIRAERQYQRHQTGQGRKGAAASRGMSVEEAYGILGIGADASDAEAKRAYRRLLSQHHPDKLVAKGLPEEMMKIATQKTHEIRTAYETIRRTRGL